MTPGQRPLLELATRIAAIAGIPAGGLNADLQADPTRITAAIRQALLAHGRREAESRGDGRSAAVIDVDAADAIPSEIPADGAGLATDQHAGVGQGEVVSSPRLVLIVDQFEEVFTADESERQAFIRALCAAAGTNAAAAPTPGRSGRSRGLLSSRDAPALVVVGMRADFYARSVTYPELVPYLQDHQVLVGPMNEAGLRAAIERPAASAGLVVEDGLVEVLLADLGLHSRPVGPAARADRPDGTAVSEASSEDASAAGTSYEAGRLPLLAYALQQTWLHREGRRLTVAAYRATGGIDGAVARAADTVYDGLDADGKQATRQLLLRLVSLGEGTADTRRRVAVTELTGTAEPPESADTPQANTARTVLTDLIQARLLTADTDTDGGDTVEISHEALLSAWPKLHEWLSQDRSGLRTHRELTEAAHAWLAHGRDPSRLFGGTRLAVASEWAASHEQDLNPDERAFLAASKKHERTVRQRRIAVAAIVVLLILSVAVSAVALVQSNKVAAQSNKVAQLERSQAQNERLQAIYNQVTAEAGQLQSTDPSLADQLYLVVHHFDPTATNTSLLLAAANIPQLLTGRTGSADQVSFSPDGHILATDSGGTVQLWNVTNPTHPAPLRQPLTGPTNAVEAVAFSPVSTHTGGSVLAIGSADGTVQLWNVTNSAYPARSATIRANTGIFAVAFDPTRSVLVVGSGDGRVELWNVTNPASPLLIASFTSAVPNVVDAMAFSSDGRILAVGSGDTIILYNLTDPSHLLAIGRPLTSPNGFISSVALNPQGNMLASGGAGTVQLWDLTNPAHAAAIGGLLAVTAKVVNAVAFSRDGRTLVAGSEDGAVRLWNVTNPASAIAIGLPITDASPVSSVAYSRDGDILAVGSSDGTVRLWNLNVNQAIDRICATTTLTRQQWTAYISQLPYDPLLCRHP